MVACAIIAPVIAKPGGPNGTSGQYDLIFAGGFTGTGRAVVNKNKVANIHGNVIEASTGATGTFKANNLNLDDGHFTGSGTVMGTPVTISGRVESADGKVILAPRISIEFCTAAGAGGKIFGKQ